jgi:hypothetical protein
MAASAIASRDVGHNFDAQHADIESLSLDAGWTLMAAMCNRCTLLLPALGGCAAGHCDGPRNPSLALSTLSSLLHYRSLPV